MKLSEANIGDTLRIVAVGGDVRARLESMGICAGNTVRVERKVPLNGTILVRVGGAAVAMRKDAARFVEAEVEI